MQGYFHLLQIAPPSLSLHQCQIDASNPGSAENEEIWEGSRLKCLSLSYCDFGEESVFLAFLRKLSLLSGLKNLSISYAGESLSTSASKEMTEILGVLLQRQILEELTIEEMQLSNIPVFSKSLERNHSLRSLNLTFDHWLDVEVIAKALNHENVTLQHFRYNLDRQIEAGIEPRWGYGSIIYYLMLNQYGREHARSDKSTIYTLMSLVSHVMKDDSKLESYPEGMINMLYGLFRQSVSIWASAGAGSVAPDNNLSRKRKALDSVSTDSMNSCMRAS